MTLHHKRLPFIAIVITTAALLAACTEKAADNTRPETKKAVPPVATVTESKIAQWTKEAKAGDPDAQYNLAYIYENGLGVPKDEAKALELYQQAAAQGNSAAQDNIDALGSPK
ncbi:tetratricopeptide repeat protein [Candidatus Methylobacter oryzae]|uniref:SEL1-like repeat protein n=1 Tax=Candidatus Methylobacter oryzae TaxID=2497749 RepID=A0ABY3CAK5_9GAMM|nr:SEL1-like repeat protein [Candidatus Methylobacter oryzae]TRW95124.1 SEL1-like repeat protein [Candidatus Methylobacter oryzae]